MKKYHEWIESRGKRLSAIVHKQDFFSETTPLVVFCHGFTGDKVGANQLMINLAKNIAAAGAVVLRFDFAGSGESEGDFSNDTTINGWQEDLRSVLAWVAKEPDLKKMPLYLLGHSLGGLIVLTNTNPSVAGRIALAAVIHPVENFRDIIFGSDLWEQALRGQKIANFFNKAFTIEPAFVRDLLSGGYLPLESVRQYDQPLLIIHGEADIAVPLAGSQELYQRFAGPKDLQIIPADHVFSGLHEEVAARIIRWLSGATETTSTGSG